MESKSDSIHVNLSYSTFDFNINDENSYEEIERKIYNDIARANRYNYLLRYLTSSFILFTVLFSISTLFTFKINRDMVITFNDDNPILYTSNVSYNITINVTSPSYGTNPISVSALPWDALVEPYRDQLISISSLIIEENDVNLTDNDYLIVWTIDDNVYSGKQVTFMIQGTGIYTGSVSITPLKSSPYYGIKSVNSLYSKTTPKHQTHRSHLNEFRFKSSDYETSSSFELYFTIASKYIRREIRSLTDDDRISVFNAMKTLYATNQTTGQALYGDKYYSAEYFAYKHLSGAGTIDCDHWHDGAGIAVNHIGVTLQYEQSLQSIDPSISLPYWDYGMDRYIYADYDSYADYPIFTADWFGEIRSSKMDHTIADGSRWEGNLLINYCFSCMLMDLSYRNPSSRRHSIFVLEYIRNRII